MRGMTAFAEVSSQKRRLQIECGEILEGGFIE